MKHVHSVKLTATILVLAESEGEAEDIANAYAAAASNELPADSPLICTAYRIPDQSEESKRKAVNI
jgi:hypothetical protein